MVYGINRLGTPGQRAIVAGEHRPYPMKRGGNTYVQVNNYGNMWDNGCCCHHHDNEESTFGKIMGWTGFGMSAAGIIADWIGLGKKGS